MWQVLREELHPKGLEVVTVALDARGAAVARPWIEKAGDFSLERLNRLSEDSNLRTENGKPVQYGQALFRLK